MFSSIKSSIITAIVKNKVSTGCMLLQMITLSEIVFYCVRVLSVRELAFRASVLMLSDTFSLVYNELSEEEIF